MRRILAALVALGCAAALFVPLWWWALLGMSSNVGTAWFFTNWFTMPAGALAGFWLVTDFGRSSGT